MEKNDLIRVISPTPSDAEAIQEVSIRPTSFQTYIGQDTIKEGLSLALKAAQKRNEPMEHLLLSGPPGLGKTSLALVVANETAQKLHITSAPALERPRDIVGLLLSLKEGELLFIDEIHRLNKVTEEILYPAMEDFKLDITMGKGKTAKSKRLPLKRFTLIGATTQEGNISAPLRARFGFRYRLSFYGEETLSQILKNSSEKLGVLYTEEGIQYIAKRSRGTPRIANRLLKRVRDYAQVHGTGTLTKESAEKTLRLLKIDDQGLDDTDRNILFILIQQYHGGPVGLEAIAAHMGEEKETLEEVYEPYLIQKGLIARTPRGRIATPLAHTTYGQFSSMMLGKSLP